MVVLLDTSALLHLALQQASLKESTKSLITDAERVLVTPIALTEIATKVLIGKLKLPKSEADFWEDIVSQLQAEELPYDGSHAEVLAALPLHHRDPFDRMIAAQCLKEDVHLATTDRIFAKYGVKVI